MEGGFLFLRGISLSRADLALENLALRQQSPSLSDNDRARYRRERDELRRQPHAKLPKIVGENDAMLRICHLFWLRDQGWPDLPENHEEWDVTTESSPVQPPTLETNRLVLRSFALSDAADLQRLAGTREVASTTLSIPHPYLDGIAELWIATRAETSAKGTGLELAVTLKPTGALVGAVGLPLISPQHRHAEIGYWIGVPYWGRGYCTEAARAMLQFGFEDLGLERIFGHYLTRNPASGRVMQKLGMRREGCWRRHVKKWGVFEDLEVWGILKSEWEIHGLGEVEGEP